MADVLEAVEDVTVVKDPKLSALSQLLELKLRTISVRHPVVDRTDDDLDPKHTDPRVSVIT